ncbi:MAG: YgjP-like metallopeptidase domain-containing protein [Cellulosilyticaceae bacterium]
MKLSFDFQGTKISYNLAYKKRTSISIQVEADGTVHVVAPVGTTMFSVADKVKGHAEWIVGELKRLRKQKENANQYMYLGKTYGIEMVEDETKEVPTVKLVRGKFVVEGNALSDEATTEAILKWYITKTTTKLKERSKVFAEHFEKMPKKYEVKVVKNTLWYIEDETIIFDVNCGIGPVCMLDTVLVEALCQYNGIADSQNKLDALVADSEIARAWVKENHDRFIFR